MSWLARLFRPTAELSSGLAARTVAWRTLPPADERTPLARTRFVVVDTETSGLNPRRDRLLAIGACPVEFLRLTPGAAFEVVLRQETASTRENILVHGLGPQAQAEGEPPEEALMAFLEYARKDTIVAFHAPFDQAVLDRAARELLGVRIGNPILDLAVLAPALCPEARLPRGSLDDWLAWIGLRVAERHRAVHDAVATGELLLFLLARARQGGIETVNALRALAERRTHGAGFGGA